MQKPKNKIYSEFCNLRIVDNERIRWKLSIPNI